MNSKIKECPVCGRYKFTEKGDNLCSVCGWELDVVQEANPDYKYGANQMSLNEAREAFKRGEEVM